jgi:arylsulfatase A-like enzyme
MTNTPNIIFIFADDLGYGDVGCYNRESKVPTPNLDKLAKQGVLFTDAHAPATVCTPSRYSVMTGRMAFRTGFAGVFTGAGGPCLIVEERLTLPGMLRDKGYTTACFGKWHIGLTFLDKDGEPICENGMEPVKRIDYSRNIPDAPIHRGFDHFYGTACCCGTDHLYAFIDGDRIPVPPTGMLDKSTLPKHPYSSDNRGGLAAPDFDIEELDQLFLSKSIAFMEEHVKTTPDKPFFLYHPTNAVHLPSFPSSKCRGKTDAGPHGDFIFEFDQVVGGIMDTLDRLGIADNTLLMVSSDNGPEVGSVYHMRKDYQHDGARPWRGVKRDNWEGGHRIPLIARWPEKIAADTKTDQTACLCDIMATCAALVGAQLPDNAAEDSFNMLPALLGEQPEEQPIRTHTLHQTIRLALSIRKGPWKYLDHQGSGGNDYEKSEKLQEYILPEKDPEAPGQLYNLDDDPGETTNLYSRHPERVKELKTQLDLYVESGKSRP